MTREFRSAENLASLINESLQVIPGLERFTVSIVRASKPDATGCNWVARYPRLPVGCSPESERLFEDVIEHARRHFNLWELH